MVFTWVRYCVLRSQKRRSATQSRGLSSAFCTTKRFVRFGVYTGVDGLNADSLDGPSRVADWLYYSPLCCTPQSLSWWRNFDTTAASVASLLEPGRDGFYVQLGISSPSVASSLSKSLRPDPRLSETRPIVAVASPPTACGQ